MNRYKNDPTHPRITVHNDPMREWISDDERAEEETQRD